VQLLSVRQPWAWAIARGRKPVENRDWATAYRGQLAIYASMRVDLLAAEEPLLRFAGWDPDDPVAAIGGIVAVVTLADVCSAAMSGDTCDCGEWARPSAYHWRLSDARPLARPVVSIGGDGHMADVIPVRTIGQPAGQADQAALWEPGPAVVAEVTAAAHLA
jgi:ASCH domain